ncbi:MAG: DUF1919 domain-containing protein [Alistipes sp.]
MAQILQRFKTWCTKRVIAVTHMIHRKRLKRRLKNQNFSILANNCVGVIILHDLRLQFNSPTINLFFPSDDEFITYLEYLPFYVKSQLEEWQMPDYSCPAGVLKGNTEQGGGIPDIHLCFLHYKTFADAKDKWVTRTARIHFDNIYIMMDAKKLTDELLAHFEKLPYANKQILTYGKQWNHPLVHTMQSIEKHVIGKILWFKGLSGRRYLDEFDFVSFLNRPSH